MNLLPYDGSYALFPLWEEHSHAIEYMMRRRSGGIFLLGEPDTGVSLFLTYIAHYFDCHQPQVLVHTIHCQASWSAQDLWDAMSESLSIESPLPKQPEEWNIPSSSQTHLFSFQQAHMLSKDVCHFLFKIYAWRSVRNTCFFILSGDAKLQEYLDSDQQTLQVWHTISFHPLSIKETHAYIHQQLERHNIPDDTLSNSEKNKIYKISKGYIERIPEALEEVTQAPIHPTHLRYSRPSSIEPSSDLIRKKAFTLSMVIISVLILIYVFLGKNNEKNLSSTISVQAVPPSPAHPTPIKEPQHENMPLPSVQNPSPSSVIPEISIEKSGFSQSSSSLIASPSKTHTAPTPIASPKLTLPAPPPSILSNRRISAPQPAAISIKEPEIKKSSKIINNRKSTQKTVSKTITHRTTLQTVHSANEKDEKKINNLGYYGIQIGVFSTKPSALRHQATIHIPQTHIVSSGKYYQVVVGRFSNRHDALLALKHFTSSQKELKPFIRFYTGDPS